MRIKETKILFHTIEYCYEDTIPDIKLHDSDREYIVYMINQGHSEGDLHVHRGWWRIKGI